MQRVAAFPLVGFVRPELAPAARRFVVLNGFPYVLVYDAESDPIRIIHVLHMARDLRRLL